MTPLFLWGIKKLDAMLRLNYFPFQYSRGLFFDKTYGNLLKVRPIPSLPPSIFIPGFCRLISLEIFSLVFMASNHLIRKFFCSINNQSHVHFSLLSGERSESCIPINMYRLVVLYQQWNNGIDVISPLPSHWIPGYISCTPFTTSLRYSSLQLW